ncbi:hypothetical protein [Dyadobacter sp. CY323]|uniref:hypothetical protein n=1 Tax=Dyadobacter sp. CY323 TaxID=2907302 RepID=UPI001F42F3B1|nr:hypothetical protein [Dyadobacter sp. CY323]MCE6991964.1 hypothetical protein [Dyadobacter sp. CY323]
MLAITTVRFIIALSLLVTLSSACSKDSTDVNPDETEKAGTFKVDGVASKGKTEIQTFVNGNYSIICQQDEPFKLLQVTFHSKAEAEKGGSFKVGDSSLNVSAGEVEVGVDGLTFDPDGKYVVSVTGNKIVMTNIKLVQTGGGSKKATINECAVDF